MKSGIDVVASMVTFGRSAYSIATITKVAKMNVQLTTRHGLKIVHAK